MNVGPAFQFYASDYLSSSKVQRMTLEAEGAYIRLLAYNWQDGFIPSEIAMLARMCKTSAKRMQSLWDEFLKECFTAEGQPEGRLTNRKLEGVRQEQLAYREKKANAGHKGANARWKDKQTDGSAIDSPLAEGMANDGPSSSPSSSSSEIKTPKSPSGDSVSYAADFLEFWEAYPRKEAKGAAWKAWKKLSPNQQTRERILDAIAKQSHSEQWRKDNGEYIPHPATWLNKRRWEDESGSLLPPPPSRPRSVVL